MKKLIILALMASVLGTGCMVVIEDGAKTSGSRTSTVTKSAKKTISSTNQTTNSTYEGRKPLMRETDNVEADMRNMPERRVKQTRAN